MWARYIHRYEAVFCVIHVPVVVCRSRLEDAEPVMLPHVLGALSYVITMFNIARRQISMQFAREMALWINKCGGQRAQSYIVLV